jgi:2-methylisocitrate lyase-like PEP mutase family enzyme
MIGPIMVTRTIKQHTRSGVAALHIEDQVQTKRCGHLNWKQLVSVDGLPRPHSVAAREAIDSDIVIIAGTNSLQSLAMTNLSVV